MKKIDKVTFEGLIEIFCTKEEIEKVLRSSKNEINEFCHKTYKVDFDEAYEILMDTAKCNLRNIQLKHAQSTPVMAIFLGKQYLDQKDKIEGKIEQSIEFVNDVPKNE